jgi:hypothetical protein
VLDDESTDTLPEENSSIEDTGSEETVDWQKRFTDTQAEYTRNQQALAEARRVWEDEQAFLEQAQEKFPHLFVEEEDETDDYEDDTADTDDVKAEDPRVDWLMKAEAERQYERDLTDVLGDREVPKQVRSWIKDRTLSLGNNRKALEKAVEEFDAITAELSQPKKKPRAPHVPAAGKAGTGVKDFSGMSREEIDAYMVERARALEAS